MADFEDKDDLYSPQIGPDMPGAPPIERYAPKAFADQGPAYGPVEQLPGITSGAPPKPWGLNRDQPLYQQPHSSSGFADMITRKRPADYNVDPQGQIGVPADSYGYRFKGKGAVAPPGGAGAMPDRSMEINWSPWQKRGDMSA